MAADGTIFVEIDPTGAVVGAKRVKKSLDSMNRSVDATTKKAGRAKTAMLDISRSLLGPLGLAAAALAVVKGFKSIIAITSKFEATVSELSAITGATGKDLEFLKDQSLLLGRTTTRTASEVAEGFKLIASAKADLLESGDALVEVTKQAITLAEAAGTTLPEAANALAGSLNQFQADADQAGRFINVLAAGSKRGAAEIPDLTASLKAAGTVAASAGLSFEETVANIESLAEVNLKAEESGTALRNIILLLQKQGIDNLDPSVVGLTTALENLNDKQLSSTELLKIFGVRNFAAVKALTLRTAQTRKLQKAITGTLTAEEQALVNNDNLEGKTKTLNSAIEGLTIAIGSKLTPALESSASFWTIYINNVTDAFNANTKFFDGLDRTDELLGNLEDATAKEIENRIKAENLILNDLLEANANVSGATQVLLSKLPFGTAGLFEAAREKNIQDIETGIAKLKILRRERLAIEKGEAGETDEEAAIRAEIEAAKKFAAEQIKLEEDRKRRAKETADAAKRSAEEQQRSFASLADSLQPLEASLNELNEAEAVLQKQQALGLITKDELKVLQGQLTEAFKASLDPIGALNAKLAEEKMLAMLSNEEMAIMARVQEEVNALKEAGVEDAESHAVAIEKEVREIDRLQEIQNMQVDTTKEVNEELELQKSILEEIRGPQESMNERLMALSSLLARDAITLEEFNDKMQDLRKTTLEGQTGVEAGFERGFIQAQENLNDFASLSEKIVTDSFQGMEDAAVNFAKTGKLEIGSLVDSILADFVRLQIRQSFAGALGSSDGKGGGSGILGLVAGLFSSSTAGSGSAGAGGGDANSGQLDGIVASLATAFASNQDGGIERTPTISRLAEKGPEAIIPLKGGNVPVEIKEPTKPPININNVFNIQTPDVQGFGRSTGQVGQMMGTAFQSALARNG